MNLSRLAWWRSFPVPPAPPPPPEPRTLPCSERIGGQLSSTMETLHAFEWLLQNGSDNASLDVLLPECPLCFTRDEVYQVDDLFRDPVQTMFVCRDCQASFASDDELDAGLDPYVMDEARDELRQGARDLDEWTYERIDNYLLSVDSEVEVHLQFSWGGPSDGIRVTVDSDGDVSGGHYYFLDWFDGARRELDRYDLETVEQVFSSAIEYARHKED